MRIDHAAAVTNGPEEFRHQGIREEVVYEDGLPKGALCNMHTAFMNLLVCVFMYQEKTLLQQVFLKMSDLMKIKYFMFFIRSK